MNNMGKIGGSGIVKCIEFTCEKSIRNKSGNIDRSLCKKGEGEYKYRINKKSVEEDVFRKRLIAREGKECSKSITKDLKIEVDKKAKKCKEPCEHSYYFFMSIEGEHGQSEDESDSVSDSEDDE